MMALTDLPPPPRVSKGPAPVMRAGTIRRTTSLDVTWLQQSGGPMLVAGRARDITRNTIDVGQVLAEDSFEAEVASDRTVTSIMSEPPRDPILALVGERIGSGFRRTLRNSFAGRADESAPLLQVLDDIPGAALVAPVAWANWDAEWLEKAFGSVPMEVLLKTREGICYAHSPGSTAQNSGPNANSYGEVAAADPRRTDDLHGWHVMPAQHHAGFRRLRRIDVSLTDVIVIDSEFQDSASRPEGGRSAVHEYGLTATADPVTFELLSLSAAPRVLPYPECPYAAGNLSRLLGTSLTQLRTTVPGKLAGVAGCTHLNDALRALAEVPALLRYLRQ
jgi:hypothetical protein